MSGQGNPVPPAGLQARLFDVFDLGITWNRTDSQATVTAVITDHTLQAVPGILNSGQDGYHDTANPQPSQAPAPGTMKELAQPPIAPLTLHDHAVRRPRWCR
jgi:hypothetical protein